MTTRMPGTIPARPIPACVLIVATVAGVTCGARGGGLPLELRDGG